jgi:hypothetical protein
MYRLSFLLILSFFLTACSGSSDNDPIINTTADYLPNVLNSSWTYSVEQTSTTDPDLDFENQTDILVLDYVSGDNFGYEVNNGDVANGTVNNILASGTLHKTESTLSYSGNLELPLELPNTDNQPAINLENIYIYDLNVSDETIMSDENYLIQETIELGGNSLPLNIDVNIKTIFDSYYESKIVNSITYNDVIEVTAVFNIDVYSNYGVFTFDIIENQDFLVIDMYFAKNVGLIEAETVQEYEINQSALDLITIATDIRLDIPSNYYLENSQELESFELN